VSIPCTPSTWPLAGDGERLSCFGNRRSRVVRSADAHHLGLHQGHGTFAVVMSGSLEQAR
jgi:hypothetical protein